MSKPLAAPAEAVARWLGASGPWRLLSTSLPLSRAALAATAVDVLVTIVSCTEHTTHTDDNEVEVTQEARHPVAVAVAVAMAAAVAVGVAL